MGSYERARFWWRRISCDHIWRVGRGSFGLVVSVNEDGTATVRFEVEELQYDTGGFRSMWANIKFSALEKVTPEMLGSNDVPNAQPFPASACIRDCTEIQEESMQV